MFSNRTFQIAFLISLISHTVILVQHANLDLSSRLKKQEKLEVRYLKNFPEKKEYPKTTSPDRKLPSKIPPKITAQKMIPPPFLNKEHIFKGKDNLTQKADFTKPDIIKPDIIAIKKKITLPPIDINKINSPAYIGYYQIVREKIRRAAYQNYTRIETGEVYLSFIIANDGSLKEVRYVQEKSSSSVYLKETALRSIKDAAPFPNFPAELDYPQLSFNVVISFEVE